MSQILKDFVKFWIISTILIGFLINKSNCNPRTALKSELSLEEDKRSTVEETSSEDQLTESDELTDRKKLLNILKMNLLLNDMPKRKPFSKRGKTYVRLLNKKAGYYNRPCLVNVMSCYFFGIN
ncbi:unnamed protein product [Brachionus calyciflorus]|uniref:Uncharacterized protein n=1 Tax=Brachionus calyciflorus TaxID=104777 RepID=A0A813QPE0_9BILA|nr:unnamed protein product [Brachionus calyciflorus]